MLPPCVVMSLFEVSHASDLPSRVQLILARDKVLDHVLAARIRLGKLEDVFAAAGDHRVTARSADESIGARAALHDHRAGPADEGIGPLTADQRRIAGQRAFDGVAVHVVVELQLAAGNRGAARKDP